MKKIIKLILAVIFLVNVHSVVAKEPDNLTILSEGSIAYPLTKIVRLYSKESSTAVSIDFNDPGESIQNIDAGEPADIFISSHPSWVEALKQKGVIDVYSFVNLAKDSLVLVTSQNNKKINRDEIAKIEDISQILRIIIRHNIPLIVDSNHSSLGKYTEVILKKANINNQKIYSKVSEDKKSIIDFVSENEDYCAIVLASSVKDYDNIVVLKAIPNSDIYYQAWVVAGDNMDKARDLLKFMISEKVKKILTRNGFVTSD